MSSLLSVIATKCPQTAAVNFYSIEAKAAKTALASMDKGCTAFLETIADIDNAHFMTMYEMQAFVEQTSGMKFNYPPRDRLIAAKELARLLSQKQKELPPVPSQKADTNVYRVCLPGSIITPCKKGTKLALFVEMMIKGATLPEMIAASGVKKDGKPCEEGGVLSSINYDIHKRKGIGYKITKREGVDFYEIVLPQGFTGPVIV